MIVADHLIELDPEILQVIGALSRLGSGSSLVLLDEEMNRDFIILSHSPYAARSGDTFVIPIVLISTE